MNTPSSEEYLEAIFKLQQSEKPVKQSMIASALNLHPTSVGEMSKRLEKKGFVTRSTGGLELTSEGERAALKLVRRHRLSERFLVDVLGLAWDKAHDEACKLEHALSDEVTDSLERFLENPASCPHGHPIPDREGRFLEKTASELSSLGAGERAIIIKVEEDNGEMLSYLASLGLLPDVGVEVEEIAPFGGPLLVKVGEAKYALGREVAAKIMVSKEAR